MLNLIVEWLNQKHNYANYKSEYDDIMTYHKRISNLLIDARVHFDNLKASDCYIVQNVSNKIDFFYERPVNHRHNYSNFNIRRNEYIYDKVNMREVTKNFTVDDLSQNRSIVLKLLNELQHSYHSKNKFLKKFDQCPYKDIFFDIDAHSMEQTKNDAETRLQENEFDFEDFKSAYIEKIKDESRGLQEIGIFYPFHFDHDIFDNKYFAFEINHLKFQKKDKNFLEIVEKFYKEYEVNCDKSKNIFTLEQYLAHPGFGYFQDFAYFNPFKNYDKFQNEYYQIRKNIALKKLEFKDFVLELFEALNKAQIGIVKFQHENLINALLTKRSIERQYSVQEFINLLIEKMEMGEFQLEGFDYAIFDAFKKQPSSVTYTKNTKIDELEGFKMMPDRVKQRAQHILNRCLDALNKDDASKLHYIFNYYKNELNIIIKKYKLNLENKHTVYDMLLDLVLFYNDKNKEKLSKPFNSKIEKIYKKNQNKDIEKIIDFEFQTKFMQQYNDYFNMYKPLK